MATEANIEETDDEYIVELDLPGVKREDVNVKARDSELRVSGEIREKVARGYWRAKPAESERRCADRPPRHEPGAPGSENRDQESLVPGRQYRAVELSKRRICTP